MKANTDPEGRRTVFRDEGEQQSERSDAGGMIVPEVFAMVKRGCRERRELWCPERSGGALSGDLGCRGKGRQPLYPLLIHGLEILLLFFLFLF